MYVLFQFGQLPPAHGDTFPGCQNQIVAAAKAIDHSYVTGINQETAVTTEESLAFQALLN